MLNQFQVFNFQCLKNVSVHLTPLHAFIGPNDSGKSTTLRAINEYMKDPLTNNNRFDSLYEIVSQGPAKFAPLLRGTPCPNPGQGAALVRFDPDNLRAISGLIPEGQQMAFFNERGTGLPGIYDAILSRGDDAFMNISTQVTRLFPSIRKLRLKAVSDREKSLETELTTGVLIPAAQFSEGLLYFLAFAAIPFLNPISVLLIEEPENGLHPARIAEVVRMLRKVTEEGKTQILMATHSPLVINELRPEEVTLVTRDPEHGTKLTPMVDTRNFADRAKVYGLGELWLSYANGMDESDLVGPTS